MIAEYYSEHSKFLLAVDCIVFGFDGEKLNLLLIERNFPPMKGEWSLMGGFLKQEESLDAAAERVLFELTGLSNVYLEQLYTYGDVYRDPGQRVISVAYYALIKIDDYDKEMAKKHNARWKPIDEFPDLIFDHNIMVEKALKRLRRKAKSQPVGFELLPRKFTMPQLLKLYEAIFEKEFDKRNFRKNILSFGVLQRLDEKDKTGSKKGAYYYKFNRQKYRELVDSGTIFEIKI